MKREIKISIYDGQDYEVKKLQKLLEPYGMAVEVQERNSGNLTWKFMRVEYDQAELKSKQTRGAGRKKLQLNMQYTVGEIRKMKERMTGEDLAKTLGVSRKTLYRRLKEAERMADEEWFL